MSRLIVKNLPSYISTEKLRAHFESPKGKGSPAGVTLTDAKVAVQPDGTSRRFGFVGYKTEAEAKAAKEWFHWTFLGTSRIEVSIVEGGSKNAPTPRPNKRPRLGPSPAEINRVIPPEPEPKKTLKQFQEYASTRGKKGPAWANEPTSQPIIDLTEPNTEPTGLTLLPAEEPAQDEPVSDLEWVRRRMNGNVEEKTFLQSDDEQEASMDVAPETSLVDKPVTETQDTTRDTILQTSRLFLRNLAYSCTESELREFFNPFGLITQVHIPVESNTKVPKGVAYITYENAQSALDAYEALDRKSFQGRLLHILAAVDRRPRNSERIEDGEGRKKSVKEEREGKRKADAGREFNWGMLYMNADAVASSIADRMNVPKSEILNPESDNAAVKLALAETHIIAETKSYLTSHGIVLDAFSNNGQKKRRSDKTILVKNIPYGTTEDAIRELFEPYGDLLRVLVPPSGTMAVVEFIHASEAKDAFKNTAYRRMGNSVIYLEMGPAGMFVSTAENGEGLAGARPVRIAEQDQDENNQDAEPSLSAGSTLFVKNLAFSTTAERLTAVFGSLAGFAFARVQTKPDPNPNRPGAKLSMGYGFVGFKTKQAATDAMKGMQGYILDGHALLVKFAGRNADEPELAKGNESRKKLSATTTKMIVKNVPFEATKKDIRELFSAHGHLKSLRLPKKFDSRSRGFAFLEFVTRHEAESAYSALQHTHLLGRHLVLEWAEEDPDVDMMRKKAGVGLGNGDEMPGRKRKVDMGLNGMDDDVGDAAD